MKNPSKVVICPFCWYKAPFSHFMIAKKSATPNIRCKCPSCEQRVNHVVLYEFSVEEKAAWVCVNTRLMRSPHDKFVEKVDWKMLLLRLSHDTENDRAFWDAYKLVKGQGSEQWYVIQQTLQEKIRHKDYTQQKLQSGE